MTRYSNERRTTREAAGPSPDALPVSLCDSFSSLLHRMGKLSCPRLQEFPKPPGPHFPSPLVVNGKSTGRWWGDSWGTVLVRRSSRTCLTWTSPETMRPVSRPVLSALLSLWRLVRGGRSRRLCNPRESRAFYSSRLRWSSIEGLPYRCVLDRRFSNLTAHMNHQEMFTNFRLVPALGDSGLGGLPVLSLDIEICRRTIFYLCCYFVQGCD